LYLILLKNFHFIVDMCIALHYLENNKAGTYLLIKQEPREVLMAKHVFEHSAKPAIATGVSFAGRYSRMWADTVRHYPRLGQLGQRLFPGRYPA
jgi:hypothetical protein